MGISAARIDRLDVYVLLAPVFVYLLCMLHNTYVTTLIATVTFVASFLYLFCTRIELFFKYLSVFIGIVFAEVGLAYIELTSFELIELDVIGGFAGSFPLFALCKWLFVLVLIGYDHYFGVERDIGQPTSSSPTTRLWLNVLCGAVLVITVVMLLDALRFPPAISEGIDRFIFSKRYSLSSLVLWINNYMPMLIFIPVIATRYANRGISVSSIVLYMAFNLWIGQKVGPFLQVAWMFCVVYYDVIYRYSIRYQKRLRYAILVVVVCLIGYAGVFSTVNRGGRSAFDYLLLRTSQQGQMWWRIYSLSDDGPHPDEFEGELRATFGETNSKTSELVGADYGIYKMMYKAAPKRIVDSKLRNGGTYTETGSASAYYYGGIVGAVGFNLLMAAITAILQNLWIRSALRREAITAMLLKRLALICMGAVGGFLFYDFFDPLSLLTYALVFGLWVMRKRVGANGNDLLATAGIGTRPRAEVFAASMCEAMSLRLMVLSKRLSKMCHVLRLRVKGLVLGAKQDRGNEPWS